MAYQFNGSSQYMTVASALGAALPWTFAAFINKNNLTSSGMVMIISDTGTTNAWYGNYVWDTTPNDLFATFHGDAFGNDYASTTTSTSQVWQHIASTFTSDSSRAVFRDGANKGTNTATRSTNNALLDTFAIGAQVRSSITNYFGGLISEVAVWNAVLTDAEIASLGKGFKPSRIRPQSLAFYAPLIRNLTDCKGGLTITNTNTATVANHPRVY